MSPSWEVDIRGGCRGCLQCSHANVFACTDGFMDMFTSLVKEAEILLFTGAVKDRRSSTWKRFFDRRHRTDFRRRRHFLRESSNLPITSIPAVRKPMLSRLHWFMIMPCRRPFTDE